MSYYIYLISTLPTLQFGARPPFSFSAFLTYCQSFIPEGDMEILRKASIDGEYSVEVPQPALKKWQDFDIALRNELVKIRSAKKHLDPLKYLRQDGPTEINISHIAINASRNPSILEAEKMLDEARWQAQEEFCLGHYFDLDFLIIYALKLLILERWQKVNSADTAQVLQETLARN